MVTYNHEDYIAQAVESIMAQKTNFKYKLFIGEDCSTDKTRGICEKLKEKYSNKIELFLNNKNLGGYPNSIQIYNACFTSGAKYTALCDGDDYWTDPFKLQKQVDFLEANHEYGLVHTNHDTLKNKIIIKNVKNIKEVPQGDVNESLLIKNFISTLTVCVRNEDLQTGLSKRHTKYLVGDLPLWMEIARNSKIGYLNCSTAVYRHVENSASHSTNYLKHFEFIKSAFQLKLDFIDEYDYKEKTIISVYNRYIKILFKYSIILDDKKIIDELLSFCDNHKSLTSIIYKFIFLASKNKLIKQVLLKILRK